MVDRWSSPLSSSALRASRFLPRTRTSGSAQIRAATFRRRAATRAAASNIATTRNGGLSATARSSSGCPISAKRCRGCAAGFGSTSRCPGLPREKVLAVVVSLLDATRMRIGNAEYARDNDSYGLTTLRNRHVRFVAGRQGSCSGFAAKAAPITRSPSTTGVSRGSSGECHQLPGQRLFQYVDDDGLLRPIESGHVNTYLKEAMGADFTAKDFRTWGATLRAAAIMHATPLPDPPTERAITGCIVDTVRKVAAELRNTPAVCRKSYINPLVFDAWRTGALHRSIGERIAGAPRKAERLVLGFLRRHARRARR